MDARLRPWLRRESQVRSADLNSHLAFSHQAGSAAYGVYSNYYNKVNIYVWG